MITNALPVVVEATKSGAITSRKARRIDSTVSCWSRSRRAMVKKWMPASMPRPINIDEIIEVTALRWPSVIWVAASDQASPHTSGTSKVITARVERKSKKITTITPTSATRPLRTVSRLISRRSAALTT